MCFQNNITEKSEDMDKRSEVKKHCSEVHVVFIHKSLKYRIHPSARQL